jgi:hypothetical protein
MLKSWGTLIVSGSNYEFMFIMLYNKLLDDNRTCKEQISLFVTVYKTLEQNY